MIGRRCTRCTTVDEWRALLGELSEFMAAKRSAGEPPRWNLRSIRAVKIRSAMRTMTKHQLYRFMNKGRTRLSAIAHGVRDVRRNHPSSWRDPSSLEQ